MKGNMAYRRKSVTISIEDDKWLQDRSINLSKFLRKAIAEAMKKKG